MLRAKRILLVDDDELLRDTLLDQFSHHEEFAVETAATAQSAIAKTKEEAHLDLVLLDVGLPDMDGREACQIMRKNGFKSPIVMLTGADTDADEVLGLNSGANDYVTKPFRFAVLIARIRAQLRSHEQNEDAVFKIGPYEFRPAVKMLVSENDKKVRLTEKEASILKYLYRAGGKPVTRDVLLDEVWGYNSGVTTHTLETHVYRLRQKIEPNPAQATILLTESGGYRLAL
jgi:DNA-binding response OmpR family regulator